MYFGAISMHSRRVLLTRVVKDANFTNAYVAYYTTGINQSHQSFVNLLVPNYQLIR